MGSTREYATFNSGPVLGRTSVSVLGSAMQMTGTGVSNNAYRNITTVDFGYAITRSITALGAVGYENIKYATSPIYRIDDAIWRVGVRWVPRPDSTLTLRYGHQDGFNSAWFDGSYALTERIRLYGRYSKALASELESLRDAVSSSVLDPLGNPIDPITGAPVLLSSNFFRVQNNDVLYRVANTSLTVTTLYDRDAIAITVSRQNQEPVASTATTTGVAAADLSIVGTYGSINWQHDLSPDLRSAIYLQYGTTENKTAAGRQASDSVVASISFTYVFSETLTGTVQYSYTSGQTRAVQTSFGRAGVTQTSPSNLVVVGLHKAF
jgi:hypothetical protein